MAGAAPVYLRNCSGQFRVLLLMILLFVSAIIINLIQLLLYPIRFFSVLFYRFLEERILYVYSCLMISVFELSSGSRIIYYGSQRVWQEQLGAAIILSNHFSFADWIPILAFCFRHSVEAYSTLRFFFKKIIAYIPAGGWILALHECVLLNRKWELDEKNISQQIRSLMSYAKVPPTSFYHPVIPKSVTFAFYPEGTFVNDESELHVFDKSIRFSQQLGRKPLQYVLFPRTTGFAFIIATLLKNSLPLKRVVDLTVTMSGAVDKKLLRHVNGMQKKIRSKKDEKQELQNSQDYYDDPDKYNGAHEADAMDDDEDMGYYTGVPLNSPDRCIPNWIDFLNNRAPDTIHVHIRDFALSDLPPFSDLALAASEDDFHRYETRLSDWLIERWYEKEELLKEFHQNGRFPGDRWEHRLSSWVFAKFVYLWTAICVSVFYGIYVVAPKVFGYCVAFSTIIIAAGMILQAALKNR